MVSNNKTAAPKFIRNIESGTGRNISTIDLASILTTW